ncbi:dolichyl-phosphate-mannose--protein mannosyltransferase [Leptospira congkakensis]|uniref:Dolichyl-phosphate-mannose--protein mannosyltransferase n=1 Tax=Leptospira congkakensis TaxID=2484932 RepID=A0A4Z1ACF4_9LEPT|nr:dolichyl-phosphate-mannose--protein mannosyltransferase [Leptospira congkakensis]TGL90254.1 dolichyl-phosphate-mannose--protein mannosyltransferase [Leptospira congkakensis]TGL91261.1 dolichyl-phosphate-mannose--protein mannosyltransferase [Leptospira congkakensis]TGL98313.1 dolichyl-phosphate-mannose--protein mannosyltransferase [Leptospira congkakensis]
MNQLRNKILEFKFEIGILLSFIVGVVLRFHKLNRQSLWGDELYSVYASSLMNWSDFWAYLAEDPHPPLFQILLSFWIRLLPDFTEFSVKLFPVAISVVNLIFLWILTKSWAKPKRFLFLFLISFSPGAIYYSQELRSYSLLLCLSSMIVVLFANLDLEAHKRIRLFSLMLLSVLISYVHLFGFIFVGSLYFIFWLRFVLKRFVEAKLVFLLGAFSFLAFLPFLYTLGSGTKIATASWIDPPGSILYIAYYSLFFYTSKKFLYLTVLVPIFALVYWVVKGNQITSEDGSETKYSSGRIFLLVALFIIISTSLFSLFKPIVTNRNWIITLPLIYYFIAENLEKVLEKWYVLPALILLTIFSLIDFKKNFYFVFKEDWRGAAHYVANHCSGPIVLIDSYPEFLSLYLKWEGHSEFLPILTGTNTKMEQSKVCVLRRFIEGNGIGFPIDAKNEKMGQSAFYGFTVEEYKLTK